MVGGFGNGNSSTFTKGTQQQLSNVRINTTLNLQLTNANEEQQHTKIGLH